MAAAVGALAFLGLLSAAHCIQQGIRLIRWYRDLVKAQESLGEPGET